MGATGEGGPEGGTVPGAASGGSQDTSVCSGDAREKEDGGGAPIAELKVLAKGAPLRVQGDLNAESRDHSRHPE